MGFTLKRSTEADLKTKSFFLPVATFIWCLTTPHAKTYITSDFTAIQSKICVFSSSLSPRLQWFEYSSCRSKQKSSILTLVKLKFQYTRRHVNKICFICVKRYIKFEIGHSGPTAVGGVSSRFLSSFSRLSEWAPCFLRAVKIKVHGQISNTVKQFTGCRSTLSRCFDVPTCEPLWLLLDTPP